MNAFVRTEILASAFYHQTGILAPVKDSPAACGPEERGKRIAAYMIWSQENKEIISAMLNAFDEQIPTVETTPDCDSEQKVNELRV